MDYVFIDKRQFTSSGLEKLAKNMYENELKYLSEEFSGEQFKLVKQKGMYPHEYMNNFEKFSEEKLPDKKHFYS